MARILGVDPGLTGGIAILSDGGIAVHDIPVAGGEIDVEEVLRLMRADRIDLAVVEAASSRPGQGVASTFKYGAAYGALQACVLACGIPMHRVAPTVWKRHFRLDRDKEKSRALALRLWPGSGCFSRKADHGRAEAALIARYGAEKVWASGPAAASAKPTAA